MPYFYIPYCLDCHVLAEPWKRALFLYDYTEKHYRGALQGAIYRNRFRAMVHEYAENSVFTMVLSVVFVVITAYALSQFRFRGRKLTLMTMLVLQAFPSFMSMIAVFLLLLQIGMLDTHFGLVIVYTAGAIPYGAWLVKGYFDSIPRSLPEAAKIDGATNMKLFAKVMLPLSTPIITFIALTNFMAPWMDFILARLVLRTASKKTLAIGLFEMVRDRMNTEFTMFAAGAVMVAIPITILFILQRYVIQVLPKVRAKPDQAW